MKFKHQDSQLAEEQKNDQAKFLQNPFKDTPEQRKDKNQAVQSAYGEKQ